MITVPNEVNITITADDLSGPGFTSAMARMLAMRAAAKALSEQMKGITFNADPSKMNAALLMLKSRLQSLGIADIADVNVPLGKITTQLMILKRLIAQAGIHDLMDINVNDADLAAQLAKIRALSGNIDVGVNVDSSGIGSIAAQIAALKAAGGTIPIIGPTQNISDKFSIQGIAAAEAQLLVLNDLLKATQKNAGGAGAGIVAAGAAAAASGGNFGRFGYWLGATVPLFGGLIHGVGLWHIALDGSIETLISVGLATAALTIGLYGLSAAAIDIYNHLNAVDSVNDALVGIKGGGGIPPLTHAIGQLQDQMAPTALELYGGGLNLINSQTGILGTTMKSVGTILEDWLAKLDLWEQTQGGFGKILASGVGFLQQFGTVFGEIGIALDNLIKADPGTAHILLDLVEGFGKVLDIVTSIPTPILAVALALHSVYLWGGLAVTGLQKLSSVTGLTKLASNVGLLKQETVAAADGSTTMESTFAGIGSSTWGGILLGAAAIGYLVYESTQATAATKSFIGGLNTELAQLNAGQALTAIPTDIKAINTSLSDWKAPGTYNIITIANQSRAAWGDVFDELKNFGQGNWVGGLKSAGSAISSFFTTGQANQISYDNSLALSERTINHYINDLGNLGMEMGTLGRAGYSGEQAIALMTLAGVKAGDTFAVMRQKVNNLIEGYRMMGEQGGILTNAVDAVTLSEELQQSKMGNLLQGYTTFITLVTGSETAFNTFATGLNTQATSAKAAGASMNGLNAASLTLRGNYTSNINDAVALYNALIQQSAAAGLGAKGYNMLSAAGKDLVGTLLAGAKGSKANTAQLYALAQVAGYNGPDSFKALSLWVGNTTGDEVKLNSITGKLTIASAGLTTDMNNLANAISTGLNAAMQQAIFQADGGQKTFDKFADSVRGAKGNIDDMRGSAVKLAAELLQETGNTAQAKAEFVTFSIGLGLTKGQADRLWASVVRLAQAEANLPKNPTTTLHLAGVGEISLRATGAYIQGESGHIQAYAGGTMGAAPGWGIVGENGPELVKFSGGEAVMPGVPGYAGGTIAADNLWMEDLSKSWSGIFNKGVGDKFAAGFAAAWSKELAAKAAAAAARAVPGTSGDVRSWLTTALHDTDRPMSWLSPLEWLVQQESGGNPRAVDPIFVDGEHAEGLLQTLPSTYAEFATVPGGIWNPVSNAVAAIRYIMSQYGSPFNIPGMFVHDYGYDSGGWLPTGTSIAHNNTGSAEWVSPSGPAAMEIVLSIDESFQKVTGLTTQQLKNIKYTVRTQGGGDVQKAFGNG